MGTSRKCTLSLVLIAAAAVAALLEHSLAIAGQAVVSQNQTVSIPPGRYIYQMPGAFTREGQPVPAPVATRVRKSALVIMRHQVASLDYQRCVDALACAALPPASPLEAGIPAVGVSFQDAAAYSRWLSAATGVSWRLPTDQEWAFAAGARYSVTEETAAGPEADPSIRWLMRYTREAAEAPADSRPQKLGSHGANEHGLFDLSGNVWEWTSSCFQHTAVDAGGLPAGKPVVNCGVRIVEGRHRAYMTYFLRDAKAGGCGAGKPPSHLGFRLVQETSNGIWDRLKTWVD